MDISNLAKEFAKIVKPEEKPVDVTLYGTTVISNGQLCVQLDGSDEITPAESTIEVAGGQRVAVLIKNHKAVITGSTTERAASSEDVDELYDQETIFNILTNNGQEQGLFLQDGKVYLNFTYAHGGTLKLGGASQNQYGILELVDASDNDVILMDNTGVKLYDTDGTTVVGSMGSSGFRLKGSSQWDYDYSVSSNLYGTCHFNYGLAQVVDTDSVAKNFPCLTLSNDRNGSYIGTSTLHIVSTGYETWLDTSQNIVLHSAQSNTLSGDTIDYDVKMRIDKYGNTGMSADCFNQTTSIGEHSALTCIANQGIIFNAYEYGNGISGTALSTSAAFDKYGLRCDSNITISNAKSFCAFSTDYLSIPLVTLSGADNIVIGRSSDLSEFGDINLRAGSKTNSAVNMYASKTTTTGTLTTGGTITSGGGLYTNGKTGVSDGVAGAAVSTTGTIHLSASGTPYIYFRYDNSTKYYTRIAQTKATANRTLTMPNSTGTLAIASSDIRLKENIQDSTVKALDLIEKVKLHEFDWKEEGRGGSPHWQCGIIADELEELDAELTSGGGYNEDGSLNVKSIDTLYLEGYIVKALQEMSERIEKLEERTLNDGR